MISSMEKNEFRSMTNAITTMKVFRKTFYKIEEKLKILDKIKQGAKKSLLIQKYKINFSTLSNWIKNEKKLREANHQSKFTVHKGPKLKLCPNEQQILNFIQKKNFNSEVIYTRDVIKEAVKISPQMKNISNKALFAWVYRFFKRNKINFTNCFEENQKTQNNEKSSNFAKTEDIDTNLDRIVNIYNSNTNIFSANTDACSAEESEHSSQIFDEKSSRFFEEPKIQADLAKVNPDTFLFNENNFKINATCEIRNKKAKDAHFFIKKETKKSLENKLRRNSDPKSSLLLSNHSLLNNENSALIHKPNPNNNEFNFGEKNEIAVDEFFNNNNNNILVSFSNYFCRSLSQFQSSVFDGIN